jgi:hypothetical protein
VAQLEPMASSDAAAALAHRRALVLSALDQAERAGEGNDALLAHLGSIRRAVQGIGGDEVLPEVPEELREWRRAMAERLGSLVRPGAEESEALNFDASAVKQHPAELLRTLAELDQRVNSPRVSTLEARRHAARDLAAGVEAAVAGGLLDERAVDVARAVRARPVLAQALWARWAAQDGGSRADRLASALAAVGDAEPSAHLVGLMQLDALAGACESSDLAAAVEALDDAAQDAAWRSTRQALDSRLERQKALESQVKAAGVSVMEEVAGRLDAPLRAIEGLMVSYFRLRGLLHDAGWRRVQDTLGEVLTAEKVDPERHEVQGFEQADEFLVRSLGLYVRGGRVRRAIVEGMESTGEDTEQ